MKNSCTLIFPHQLFDQHPCLGENNTIYLVEHPLFFSQYSFHKKKLQFHRSSMQYFAKRLEEKGHDVRYVEFHEIETTDKLIDLLVIDERASITIAELDDDWLNKQLSKACHKQSIEIVIKRSPGFLTTLEWSEKFFETQKTYFQTSYYIAQRKRLNVLLDDGKPEGGSWSYDSENRKKLPKDYEAPSIEQSGNSDFDLEATAYVEKHFSKNPGSLQGIRYPATHKETSDWLDSFIEDRLNLFGDYQDAISKNDSFLNHSLLSASINVGLITPREVIQRVLDANKNEALPLHCLEGFIRQILGWREYFRAIYSFESVPQRTTNYFGFSRSIPGSFWNGTTGIDPVDDVIERVNENAYAHHIERLMILGNFMLLCEFDPDEVYRWFMELFIDAYDWVMVPNVYGMSQHADGGLITTKPYISSSNYVRKMSDYGKGDWCDTWDALYWNFLHERKELFAENKRMGLMLSQLNRMSSEKLEKHLETARSYLDTL